MLKIEFESDVQMDGTQEKRLCLMESLQAIHCMNNAIESEH